MNGPRKPSRDLTKIGRYQIESWIASGAMGDVYCAHDPVINRRVAVKILRYDPLYERYRIDWLERFRREAHAAGHRSHPHIVTIYDFGEDEGSSYLVMEYITGQSLDARIKQHGPMPFEEARAAILQVLDALGFAHTHGVIHRDIKPSNIMLREDGIVKVTDFGIAHVDSSELTLKGDLIGTPFYMAPEYFFGAKTDHRADIFSTGVVLFETITGTKPYHGRSVTEIISQMQTYGPDDILAHCPTLPPVVQDIIERALAFDAEQRFGSAAEFARALTEMRVSPVEHSKPVVVIPPAVPRPTAEQEASSSSLSFEGEPLLGQIETNLARFIGPVARVVLRRTIRDSSPGQPLSEIVQRVALYIDNATDRDKFIQATLVPRAETNPSSLGGREISTIPPNVLSRVEVELSRYIGPIARVLVRRQLTKSSTVSDLYRELAKHIPEGRDRDAFLNTSDSE
jgi:eukaryotic-like serine/threonine-protein kinase